MDMTTRRPRVRVALVTAAVARDVDEDLLPLAAALLERDAAVSIAEWDDPAFDWAAVDLAVLRSPWDYTMRLAEFLAWAAQAAAMTTLVNSLSIIRWNTDKHYLADLAAAGVPTVPSAFVEPRQDATATLDDFLGRYAGDEFVVKPAVGAGSRDMQRYGRADRGEALAHMLRLLEVKGSVVLQPYLDRVDTAGETGLLFFGGEFSHAIRKAPLLRRGEAPTRSLFAPERITPRAAESEELAVAKRALAAIPFGVPRYARVDLLRDGVGAPCLLELELTEPSLFFAHAPGSVERCASAILERA